MGKKDKRPRKHEKEQKRGKPSGQGRNSQQKSPKG